MTDWLLVRSFSWWHKWRRRCSWLPRFLVQRWVKWYWSRWWTTNTPQQITCYKDEFLITGMLTSIAHLVYICVFLCNRAMVVMMIYINACKICLRWWSHASEDFEFLRFKSWLCFFFSRDQVLSSSFLLCFCCYSGNEIMNVAMFLCAVVANSIDWWLLTATYITVTLHFLFVYAAEKFEGEICCLITSLQSLWWSRSYTFFNCGTNFSLRNNCAVCLKL